NIIDLMTLQPEREHPHGLSYVDFDSLFTTDKPIIFAFHGYPWLIHRLTYRRTNHKNLHVRGYKEEGTTTTPFDMVVLNDLDRFHLVMDVIDRVPELEQIGSHVKQLMRDKTARPSQLYPAIWRGHAGDSRLEVAVLRPTVSTNDRVRAVHVFGVALTRAVPLSDDVVVPCRSRTLLVLGVGDTSTHAFLPSGVVSDNHDCKDRTTDSERSW